MIAIDWGTSSCRSYRLDTAGAVVERRQSSVGVAQVPHGAFADHLESEVGDWLVGHEGPVVMSGMIGSRNGWLEVPYLACPAGLDQITAGLREVRWKDRRAWIVPGLSCRDGDAVPEVLRGEETQIVGVLDQLPARALVCLPGTHSKWCRVESGRVERFTTYLTGELFAIVRDHSILRHTVTTATTDPHWFDQGVLRSSNQGGLLHHLFGVRSRMLFGEVPPEGTASYLSGIMIGHELREAEPGTEPIYLIGAAELTTWYRRALESLGRSAIVLDHDAAASGLFALGRRLPRS